MDILLTSGYYMSEDEHERKVMKAYPGLGILYVGSHLKARGFAVQVRDNTFGSKEQFRAMLPRRDRPYSVSTPT